MKWDLIDCCGGPTINEHILLSDGKEIYYFYFKNEEDIKEIINDLGIKYWGFLGSISLSRLPDKQCPDWWQELPLMERKRQMGMNVSFIKTGKQIKSSKQKDNNANIVL